MYVSGKFDLICRLIALNKHPPRNQKSNPPKYVGPKGQHDGQILIFSWRKPSVLLRVSVHLLSCKKRPSPRTHGSLEASNDGPIHLHLQQKLTYGYQEIHWLWKLLKVIWGLIRPQLLKESGCIFWMASAPGQHFSSLPPLFTQSSWWS